MKNPFDLKAGTEDMYRSPVYYDNEFKNRRGDVFFYTNQYIESDRLVLELGVGSGRIAAPAVRKGAQVLGLDINMGMLQQAAIRRAKLPKKRQSDLLLAQADMRHFAIDHEFEVISCPFNAFQHLYTREDVEQCLASVRAHLEPGGVFIFDVLTPDLDYLNRAPTKWYGGTRFKHPVHGSNYIYAERSEYDAPSQINQMWFCNERCPDETAGPREENMQLSHRYFFPQELEALLHYNGFRTQAVYGDFDGESLRSDSDSIITICTPR